MAVVRCPAGHYYDNQMFSICPHCGVSTVPAGTAPQQEKPQKAGFFGKLRQWREDASGANGEDEKTVAFRKETEEDHTLSVRDLPGKDEDDQVTVSHYSSYSGTDYVTGWLVCTKGPETGRDFRIGHGMQKLGRSPLMDISVTGDKKIAEQGHAMIAYDDRSNQFFVSSAGGESVYLNGEFLGGTAKLSEGDELLIGESTLVFIPFCKGDRVWKQSRE